MNMHGRSLWTVSSLLFLGMSVGWHAALAGPPPPPTPQSPLQAGPAVAEEGPQVLTRGPVHEAFAEPVTYNPEPGIIAPKAPPPAIEELPPDQRPEGSNVVWIPGYWAWDNDRSDFIWVSGIWRNVPAGRQWVPGYWARSGQGYQWTCGYWADSQVNDVEYLPEPPESVEAGPNVAEPTPDSIWLPGCWMWEQNRYAWRPGYWAAAQPDWIWVPAITSGRGAALFLSTVTGITPSDGAACCLPRSVSKGSSLDCVVFPTRLPS